MLKTNSMKAILAICPVCFNIPICFSLIVSAISTSGEKIYKKIIN